MTRTLQAVSAAALLAVGLATPAAAVTPEELTLCEGLAATAAKTLAARYAGWPMTDAMQAAQGGRMAEAIVIDVYSMPLATTDKAARGHVAAFMQNIYRICVRAFYSAGTQAGE